MKPVGRPTDYRPEYGEQARKLCLLGATDVELADFFGVVEATINNWKIAFPEFLVSINKGKQIADAEVASRLYHRALGYEHDDMDIRAVDGAIVQTPIRKYYPPDTRAGEFWLKNRRPADWREKIVHAGDAEAPLFPHAAAANVLLEKIKGES